MRLTEAAFADNDDGTSLVGADGLNTLQQVMRGIRYFQELLAAIWVAPVC